MRKLVLTAALLSASALPLQGASLSKTYSYFTIGGTTVEEIENELARHGPQIKSTGARHPGATRIEFTSRVSYGEANGRCSVVQATVSVKANVILPRWNRRRSADGDTRLIWDTLSADIKRHEESHVVIARNHAREMEAALKQIRGERDCAIAQQKAKVVTDRVLAKHDAEQERFDRIEGINFERRLLRQLRHRITRTQATR